MAPKALTDCPENLRESIDWLIQVKHGGGIPTLSNALGKLFDHVAQDVQKSLPALPESDVPSARDIIDKLQTFQSSLQKNSANNNQNLLHNLCSAFETFLGYRHPGIYDGSGIVYGDASRLCDAVLAFLYAVLNDVYENQPYVAGRTKLKNVVRELREARWTGHHGFKHVIPKVAGGLGEYNTAVKASNEKIKRPIKKLLEYVKEGGELSRGINDLQVSDTSTPSQDEQTVEAAASLVDRCKEVARDFSKKLESAKTAIGDLNPKLRSKLENARKSFFNHVGWLSKWSRKGQKKKLDEMIHKIKTRLRRLGKEVKDRIKQEVHALVELLKERVRKIKSKLEEIGESLAKYVQDLVKWMEEAKEYIDEVKKYVENIFQEIYGDDKKKMDQAAGEIDRTLSEKVSELKQWIEAADEAVQAAKKKAEDVYGRLDHNNNNNKAPAGTTIGQNIEKIRQAQQQVKNVDEQLQGIHTDLGNWKSAANSVLDSAVKNAGQVREKLDHKQTDKENHIIGHNISNIEQAKQGIVTANETLRQQVGKLHSWISTAEGIRQKAQKKAEEAYSKLDVHAELSKKIGDIVTANKKINEVHMALGKVHGSLETWKGQASTVLQGAIGRATDVHDALEIDGKGKDMQLAQQITGIDTANKAIKRANDDLYTEVQHLGKWRDAAGSVIDKADEKCEEILKRVDKNHKDNNGGNNGPEIFLKAKKLSEDGKTLLKAATEAKNKVGQYVTAALDAVVKMDGDLKKDLHKVKTKITDGIREVIERLQVERLDQKLKIDLASLRQEIKKLGDDEVNGLVRGQLDELTKAKTMLEEVTGRDTGSIDTALKGMDHLFEQNIKTPLTQAVDAVVQAIGMLGQQFSVKGEPKKLQQIFAHIKGDVGEIKGNPGANGVWKNEGKGLEAIIYGVKRYAKKFDNTDDDGKAGPDDTFDNIVAGWVRRSILPNEPMDSWVMKYADSRVWKSDITRTGVQSSDLDNRIATVIKEKLNEESKKAAAEVTSKIKNADASRNEKIKKYVDAVNDGCKLFARQLGEKLKQDETAGRDTLVKEIAREVEDRLWTAKKFITNMKPKHDIHTHLISAVRRILPVLASTAWKAGDEVEWFIGDGLTNLSKNVHGALDKAKTLESQLTSATNTIGQNESPAQAVDTAIGVVQKEVQGLGKKFTENIKQPFKEAVEKLPGAVQKFDEATQTQVKAAAKKAIDEAAEVISTEAVPTESEMKSRMQTFMEAYGPLKSGLKDQLEQKVNEQLPRHSENQVALKRALSFLGYSKHVNQNGSTNGKPKGFLPSTIGNIKSEGLKDLSIIDVHGIGQDQITPQTFTDPFNAIGKELQAIAWFVDKSENGGNAPDGYGGGDDDGIKDHMNDLRKGLGNEQTWQADKINAKGLEKIKEAIHKLQTSDFTNQHTAIQGAITNIKVELEKLRKGLKNENGKPDNDVIERLKDLEGDGFGTKEDWKQSSGKSVGGLGKIEEELKTQSDILPGQTGKINDAILEIRGELARIGIALKHDYITDDLTDELRWLKSRIGKENPKDGNLQHIHDVIDVLQSVQFTEKPDAIGKAKDEITKELKELQELQINGLGTSEDWRGHNAKGLENIKQELQAQQTELNKQPGAINQGVTQITNELESLRSELQGKQGKNADERGVIKNMEFMIEKIGTNDDDNDSLKKINKDIATLNRDTVPKVNKHLTAMCEAIQKAGAYAGWHMGQLETTHINGKLNGIKNDIDTLRISDLPAAIAMCTDFLGKADEIERSTVRELQKFVNDEVEEAMAELTKQARQQYVESVQDALKHFANKVAGEMVGLPKEIEHDLTIGFKGFMDKMVIGFVKNVEGIKNIDFKDFKNRSPLSHVAEKVSEAVHGFFPELMQQEEFLNGKFPKPAKSDTSQSLTDEQLEALESIPANMFQLVSLIEALDDLIQHVEASGHFDFTFTAPLDSLKKQLRGFTYDAYDDGQRALLRPLKNGINNIYVELSNSYISTYSGATFTGSLVEPKIADQSTGENARLTPYGEKCAKVLLSMLPILDTSITMLSHNCKSLAGQHLNQFTDVGKLLVDQGYNVPDYAKQNGELNRHVTGKGVTMLLVGDFKRVFNSDTDTKNAIGVLLECLNDYYKACHYATLSSTRTPCNVYEMLCWLTGLKYNCVYDKLRRCIKLCYSEQTENSIYPSTLTADALVAAVDRLTAHCPSILTRVLGYGDAYSTYACDFYNNSTKLYYPQDGEECLHLLLHIFRLVFPVLRYLFFQCSRAAHHGGWAQCRYGKGVTPYTWQCAPPVTAMPTPHPECTDKSPLMSYLNDCLPGHLPHQVSAIGCEPRCNTCPISQPGMPCLTPLGFRGFSVSTKTGKHLCEVLTKLLANRHLSSLFCLEPRPPVTLSEHFGFAFSLVREWRDASQNSFQECFRRSITDVSMGLYTNTNDLTNALSNAYGSSLSNHSHTGGDPKPAQLSSLSMDPACLGDAAHCAPYLSTLCFDPYHYLAHRHSDLYLSWAVYLPWRLLELLYYLYTAFCYISCRHWGCGDCLHEDPCDRGSHGVLSPQSPASGCRCRSTVHCRGVMPTLYQHGLTFKDAPALASQNTTCFSFRTQLSYVLNSEYFRELFDQCDQFLYRIRMPFLCAIIALWLLATLYILSALLYRLDLLRIHSHLLTTRASHLIDVKALLAGSRRMLSLYKDVDYFDDDFHS
ncbi:Extracellular matrix-binding ebh [Babesia ovata]|uniref:Extracellular matrix-binding ebh n=1 Tax=Babesia ovata TaxID=189622 RepID=A0A2H6K6J5_9APIC|nr:Extracellular matrix-binding ebh [Babesia ovata]GBE58627.1 Extracellular matrix-binding ebh [Babesia ovata]